MPADSRFGYGFLYERIRVFNMDIAVADISGIGSGRQVKRGNCQVTGFSSINGIRKV